jgi:hypothetical protein
MYIINNYRPICIIGSVNGPLLAINACIYILYSYITILSVKKYRKYLQTSPCICRWVPMYNSMNLYTKKTFILMTFRSPSDAATILKFPRIDAVSEPEIVIKLIENYYFFGCNIFIFLF